MKINKFAFYHDNTSLKKYKIPEGPTTIKKLLTDDQYHCYFPFFKKHNLIFVDQLTSLCKNFLLSIFELKEKRYTSYFKVTPTTKRLYTDLTRILYKNQRTLELKNNIKDIITYRDITHNLKGSITVYPYNNKTDKEKIAIFDIEDVLETEEVVFVQNTESPELFKGELWYFEGLKFRGGPVWKSFIGRLLSRRSGSSYFEGPEEADRSISKQTEDGPHLAADQVSSRR
ncbi:hypothetical protein RclHR1_20080001 [Rhizophagus clarus]|uniref:Uncharacterized protein n=1 Tax=Rhizophagus clarus TaxID=94130 RepID=A0A2Z6RJ51_9GLOM|nr:hypothetical protein RclHR1_20080001 [Rhizophagus clarus]